jgi:leader peptidase (prepilin peptidase)/N-methyltransferase
VQYPLIEAASAGIVMVLWFWYVRPHVVAYGPGWRLLPVALQAVSLWVFLPLAVIDGRHGVLPDSFTLSGLLLALGVSFFPYGTAPLDALIGAVTGGGILFVIGYGTEKFIVKRPAIGGGDIKFMAWAGALWGWQSTFMSIFFGSVLGLVLAGIGYALSGAYTMKREIPFGPFLVVGVWISAFFGEELLAWYFGLWGMSG